MQQQGDSLLKYIVHTRVGEGAKQIENSNAHLLSNDGVPKQLV